MVVFPREAPVIENLNSYYLDVPRLLEHYQGQLGSGVIDFRSSAVKGAVFFDKDGALGGVYESREERLLGKQAIERLLSATRSGNFTIGVFRVKGDEIYYWASLLSAERVYADLSAEFTDLEALIRKMSLEKLSGYIEILLGESEEGGRIFFRNGMILGGASLRGNGSLDQSREIREAIVQKARKPGWVFHVSRIAAAKREAEVAAPANPGQTPLGSTEALLAELEGLIQRKKSRKENFGTLLRKKFLDLTETYPFLDPFAGEFIYEDHKIRFTGEESEARVVEGLLASLTSVAEESGVRREFEVSLEDWLKKHEATMRSSGLKTRM